METIASKSNPPPSRYRPRQDADFRRENLAADQDRSVAASACFWGLLIFPAAGAFLRFWHLAQQPYWCDEAATMERICSSMDHLIDALQNQAFPPGWYILLRHWLHYMQAYTGSDAQGFLPQYLRTLPAIFGTLTIPAMYFLGRQFLNRRGAMLVTLLTAVNPYLIYYSRDIKMYAALWFFVALHVALFFKWLSVREWGAKNLVYWPLVLLTGIAMVNLHDMAWFIIGFELLWLITQPRLKGLDGPLWILSVGIMAVIPIYWHLHKTKFYTRADDGGLGWMQRYTDMSPHTLLSLPTSQLLGFLWPEQPVSARMKDWFDLGTTFHEIHWLAVAQWWAGACLLIVLFAGLFPWRAFSWNLWKQRINHGPWYWKWSLLIPVLAGIPWTPRQGTPERRAQSTRGRAWWVALWIIVPTVVMALTWVDDAHPLKNPFTGTVLWNKQIFASFHDMWEPRHLGIIVPALILWLATSLSRLPNLLLRSTMILLVVVVSVLSALSNHLVYRQAPFDVTARLVIKYMDKAHPDRTAYGVPWVEYAQNASLFPFVQAAGSPILPQLNSNDLERLPEYEKILPSDVSDHLTDGVNGSYAVFLKRFRNSPRIQVIVMTDRLEGTQGDTVTDDMCAKILGDHWELKEEESHPWYYEWRFYVYHIWRTRVWVKKDVRS